MPGFAPVPFGCSRIGIESCPLHHRVDQHLLCVDESTLLNSPVTKRCCGRYNGVGCQNIAKSHKQVRITMSRFVGIALWRTPPRGRIQHSIIAPETTKSGRTLLSRFFAMFSFHSMSVPCTRLVPPLLCTAKKKDTDLDPANETKT